MTNEKSIYTILAREIQKKIDEHQCTIDKIGYSLDGKSALMRADEYAKILGLHEAIFAVLNYAKKEEGREENE